MFEYALLILAISFSIIMGVSRIESRLRNVNIVLSRYTDINIHDVATKSGNCKSGINPCYGITCKE